MQNSAPNLPGLVGMPGQIEWAEQIRPRVDADFDRVARALRAAGATPGILAILEEKRAEVMANDQAGYFIVEWQELTDQVRRLLGRDPRYQAIQLQKAGPK